MSLRNRERRRTGGGNRLGSFLVLLVAALAAIVGPAGTAYADTPFAPQTGSFVKSGAPIYADPVDGWGCLLLDGCRGEARQSSDPAPVAASDHAGAATYLRCRLGFYYKITYMGAGYETGWTQVTNVQSWGTVRDCNALDL